MASEQSTERIIDLIYGELPEEEEEQMRRELADSAELRAELDSYEDLLGQVRSAMPPEEPSPSVHDAIMEAARAAAENGGERRSARRAPDGAKRMGVWGRLSNSSLAQVATVAAVLLAGVFVVKFVDRGTDPTMAPASDISAAREPAPVVERAAPAEATEEVAATADDKSVAAAEGAVEQADLLGAENAPADEPKAALELAEAEEEAQRPVEKRRRSAAATRRDAPKDTRPVEEKPRRREMAKKKPRPKKKAKAAPLLDSLDEASGNRNEADQDLGMFGAGESESTASAAPQKKAEAAPPAPKQQQEAREYRPESGTIGAVEQRWRTQDYSGTVRAADAFLESGNGSATDKARAMQLKADAYMKQKRYRQAERIYSTIQKNYPSYQSSTIQSSLAEAKQRLEQPRRKSRSRPSKSDDAEMMYEDSAPAEPAALD